MINIKSLSKLDMSGAAMANLKGPMTNIKGMLINEGNGGIGGALGQLLSVAKMAAGMLGGSSSGSTSSQQMQDSSTEINNGIDDAKAATNLADARAALAPLEASFDKMDSALSAGVGGYSQVAEYGTSLLTLSTCTPFSTIATELADLSSPSSQVGWIEFNNIQTDLQVLITAVHTAGLMASMGQENTLSGATSEANLCTAINAVLNASAVNTARANIATRLANIDTLVTNLNIKIQHVLDLWNTLT